MLQKTHLWVGLVGMVLFLLSGQYFHFALNSLQDMESLPRLLLRTSHVYLFFASTINIVVGLYYIAPEKLTRWTILNQSLLLVSPVLLVYSFMFEAINNSGIERPIGLFGIILVFIWLVNVLIGKTIACYKNSKQATRH